MRKLGTDGRPIDIEPRREVLLDCLRQEPGLAAVYLYGSYGTPYQTPLSDVDLALIYRTDQVPTHRQYLNVLGRILDAVGEDDVSVTLLNRAPAPFQFRVLSTGRLLYCADRQALADFVESVINLYGDVVTDYEAFLREYDAALVERYAR